MKTIATKLLSTRRNGKGTRPAISIVFELEQEKPWYEWRNGNGKAESDHLFCGESYERVKRLLDLTLCLLALPFVLVAMAICCVAIKVDSAGPAVFSQWRTGKGGKRFKVYKLRTMVKNAAELREKYLHLNELKPPDFKITNDPRVTRVGRFLRKWSLDELPQIFNVIKGDMSLVGPRPSSYEAHTYNLWHTARFELKPGVTGLAQVCGRSELLLDDKLRYDIAYLRNISLWLDLQILLRTVAVVVRRVGVK